MCATSATLHNISAVSIKRSRNRSNSYSAQELQKATPPERPTARSRPRGRRPPVVARPCRRLGNLFPASTVVSCYIRATSARVYSLLYNACNAPINKRKASEMMRTARFQQQSKCCPGTCHTRSRRVCAGGGGAGPGMPGLTSESKPAIFSVSKVLIWTLQVRSFARLEEDRGGSTRPRTTNHLGCGLVASPAEWARTDQCYVRATRSIGTC